MFKFLTNVVQFSFEKVTINVETFCLYFFFCVNCLKWNVLLAALINVLFKLSVRTLIMVVGLLTSNKNWDITFLEFESSKEVIKSVFEPVSKLNLPG